MSKMARYCTAGEMRTILGLPTSTADPNYDSDQVLNFHLDQAHHAFLGAISVLKRDDPLTGNIDGTNTTFNTSYYPIADRDFDGTIGTLDVDVYGWGDSDDLDTKTSLAVASVDWKEGRIKLSSPPSSTFEVITADYRYSLYEPNFDLFKQAVAYLAGYFYFSAKYMEVPTRLRVGAAYYMGGDPTGNCWRNYLRVLSMIRSKIISKGTLKDLV